MNKPALPQLVCRRLREVRRDAWEPTIAALRDAQPCRLGQAWLPTPQKEFRPATVRTGWTDTDLVVFAELEDADIFNPVTGLNALSFQHGDVFEMFLRPVEQTAYCEFHVSPQNQKLQLRFPSSQAFRAPRENPGIPPAWMISKRQIASQVRVEAERNLWSVLAAIPVDMVADSGRVEPGSRWLFSFTSPHPQINFHRQEEWGTLVFE
jgi:hypothetical protein